MTDGPIDNQTFPVDNIRRGVHPETEKFSHLSGRVQKDRERAGLLFEKLFYGIGAFLAVNPVNPEPLGPVLRIELFERRTFFPAIGSPGRPEIN